MNVRLIGVLVSVSFLAIYFYTLGPKRIEQEPAIIHEPIAPVQEVVVEEEVPTPIEEVECLAINTYHEARGQSVAGQLAVMHVVLNRVNSQKFPDTICGVITQGPTYVNWLGNEWPIRDRCQFSWYCDGRSDTAEDVKAYDKIKELAEYVTAHQTYDYTEGATYYHADYVSPNWSKKFRKIVKIDEHIFYKP
jgi:spore germination cell wall hydrolase CwlJ-like protein